MKKLLYICVALLSLTLFTACSSSKSKSSDSATSIDYDNIAAEILSIFSETGASETAVTYVRGSESQPGYLIMAFDDVDGYVYTAIDVSNYDSYAGPYEFLADDTVTYYYGLDYDSSTDEFVDYTSGLRFSKTNISSADTAKVQEIVDNYKLQQVTSRLSIQFGLSSSRAKEVAALALQVNTADKSKMTLYQYDQYSKAILGSTYDEVSSAFDAKMSGSNKELDQIYERAAKTNGISKSSIEKLAEYFM